MVRRVVLSRHDSLRPSMATRKLWLRLSHVEGYFTVVADDDGADVEAVGCHGGEGDGPAVRCDDGGLPR